MPLEAEHWSLTMLREKLVKIGAKVVRHGRYITFHMPEVAIPMVVAAPKEARCASGSASIWAT